MKRREFITLLGGTTAIWPLAVRAQQTIVPVVGVLSGGFPASSGIFIDAFKQGMSENGLVEGRDYVLEAYWAEGDYKRFEALATKLTQRRPRVILVATIAAAQAAQHLAPATPLIMTGLLDPVGAGLITSLARPGGNTTGISNMVQDMSAKGLELLLTAVPTIKAIAVLFNPLNPGNRLVVDDLRSQAPMLGVTIRSIEFDRAGVLDSTIDAASGADALLVVADGALNDLRERIVELALQHRLATVTSVPEFTDVGALISYGPSRRNIYRRAATYAKKVLDGVKPADLPVEQPTSIELSVNMRTAKALGIRIPDTLIARADRVIE